MLDITPVSRSWGVVTLINSAHGVLKKKTFSLRCCLKGLRLVLLSFYLSNALKQHLALFLIRTYIRYVGSQWGLNRQASNCLMLLTVNREDFFTVNGGREGIERQARN